MYLSPIPESKITEGDWDLFIRRVSDVVHPPAFIIENIVQHPFPIISQATIAAQNAIQAEEDEAIFAAINSAIFGSSNG
jgi:hypothetical protein